MQLKALYELCFPTVICSSVFLQYPAHCLCSLLKKQANQMRWFVTSMTERKDHFFAELSLSTNQTWGDKRRDGGVWHGTSRIEMLLLSLDFLQPRPGRAPGSAFMSGEGEYLYWLKLLFSVSYIPVAPIHLVIERDQVMVPHTWHTWSESTFYRWLSGWSLEFYLIIN